MRKNLPLLLAASFIAAVLATAIALGAIHKPEEEIHETSKAQESHTEADGTEESEQDSAH